MSEVVKIKKGLDIKMVGKAEHTLQVSKSSDLFAIKPTDFHNLTPKLLVRVDDEVKVGTALFQDKYRPEIKFTSPVSGKVVAVNRGERRRILEVVIESDGKHDVLEFKKGSAATLSADEIKENLLGMGLWPFIKQRPYGIIANPETKPKAIFISGFDSAPLAPDYAFILKDQLSSFQTGIDLLAKMSGAPVHVSLPAGQDSPLKQVKNAKLHTFAGPHPAGNVGIQIHHIAPINKGETAWTVGPQEVAMIGRSLENGHLIAEKIVALAGSEVIKPQYYKTTLGASIKEIVAANIKDGNVRYISGNVLTGTKISKSNFLGFYDSLLSVIPEGDYYELFGWALPGFGKFSTSRTFFSWLTPNKEYRLDTNYHGGERAFVMSGEYNKVVPMEVMPVQLLKAILAEDIDAMEQLGIYEVIEEDFALCEFVCTSKIDSQEIIRNGLNLMIKELS